MPKLVLLLDDLHWADSGSLNLLFHLARTLQESSVLILATFRPDDVALGRGGERHPLESILNELKRYYGDIIIDLSAAQVDEGRSFVDALIDQEANQLDASFRQQLFAHTDGHPLFTVELLRDLRDGGYLIKDSQGRWVQGASIDWNALPARVEGVIAERIGRLDEHERETLTVGSVMGNEFYAQVIGRVQGADEREVIKQLARDLGKLHQLVKEEGETQLGDRFLSLYRFVHVLFQQYLYNDLSAGERRLLHGQVAQALETLCEGQPGIAVQLAHHYQEAHQDAKAFLYSVQAGDEAARVYAYPEARVFFAQALAALQRSPDSDETRRRRAEALVKQVSVSLRADGPYTSCSACRKQQASSRRCRGRAANHAATGCCLPASTIGWAMPPCMPVIQGSHYNT